MNATELATLSMSELKAICTSHAIEVIGDKRSKATYIKAVESFQSQQPVTDIESLPGMPDPFEVAIDLPLLEAAVMAERSTTLLDLHTESDGSPTFTPQPPTTQRQALIVMLVPLIMLSALFIVVGMGLRSLIPLIAAVVRLWVSIWGFSNREDVPTSFVLISSAQS